MNLSVTIMDWCQIGWILADWLVAMMIVLYLIVLLGMTIELLLIVDAGTTDTGF